MHLIADANEEGHREFGQKCAFISPAHSDTPSLGSLVTQT
jgi:hypothetical protein